LVLMSSHPPRSTIFPYTTLFRSFSSVGSASDKEKQKPAETEQPKAPARTVAVVTPPRSMHARAIRISGLTEADKRAVLATRVGRSEEHTSELQSRENLVCRLLLE